MSAVLQMVEKKPACSHNHVGSPSRCKECRKEAYRGSVEGKVDTRKTVIENEAGRECLKCSEMKGWDEFANDVHGYNGKTATCKPCRKIKHKKAYDENPSVRRTGGLKVRKDIVMRKYGVTYEHIVQTLINQHSLCANRACGTEISLDTYGVGGNRAVIDHNHETGKFRALLCNPCNTALGLIEAKKNIMLGLMEYKAKHND